MGKVSESLAGRTVYLELPPFCPAEWQERPGGLGPLDLLFESDFKLNDWPDEVGDWRTWLLRGGFPSALSAPTEEARKIWFSGYVQTYLERDLRQLSAVSSLPDFQRVMALTANRCARVLNQSDLANRLDQGFWLEQAIFQSLQSWRSLDPARRKLHFWRDRSGCEVDFVLEKDGVLVALEIKASQQVTPSDANGINAFRQSLGKGRRFQCGAVLHAGSARPLGQKLWALPWCWLFGWSRRRHQINVRTLGDRKLRLSPPLVRTSLSPSSKSLPG